MNNLLSSSANTEFSEKDVDLWHFTQYLKISSVFVHFFLPDDFILDRPSKYALHFVKGYNPGNAMRHIVWHLACSLYTRALSDKSFFLADHKHLDICNNRKKIIDLVHSVDNLTTSYIQCHNRDCREHRKPGKLAYSTAFTYNEVNISTFHSKVSFTSTDFFCRFSLPEILIGLFNANASANANIRRFLRFTEKLYPDSTETFSPTTISGMLENNPIGIILDITDKNFDYKKITRYTNLKFPSMIKNIRLHNDEEFLNNIRRAKFSIIEKSKKTLREDLLNLLSNFELYAGDVIDILNSRTSTAMAMLLGILAFFGISFQTLKKIANRKRESKIHVQLLPNGGIRIKSDDEVIFEALEPNENAFLLAMLLKNLSEK